MEIRHDAKSYFYAISREKHGSPSAGKRGTKLEKYKPRSFAGGLDGRRSQTTRAMPKKRVEEDQAQTKCQEIESVSSALHAEMWDELIVCVFFLITVS